MDEIRFTLEGGKGYEGVHKVDDVDGRGSMVIMGDPRPDFVVYPREPAFGDRAGKRGDIVEVKVQMVRCPVCKAEGNKTVWKTEHGFAVILCSGCRRYVWVKRKPEEEE